jgi:hypothetical protein
MAENKEPLQGPAPPGGLIVPTGQETNGEFLRMLLDTLNKWAVQVDGTVEDELDRLEGRGLALCGGGACRVSLSLPFSLSLCVSPYATRLPLLPPWQAAASFCVKWRRASRYTSSRAVLTTRTFRPS